MGGWSGGVAGCPDYSPNPLESYVNEHPRTGKGANEGAEETANAIAQSRKQISKQAAR